MYSLTSLAILLAVIAIYKILSVIIGRYLWNKHSILRHIHLLSKEKPQNEKFPRPAIICGGSIGGLFAARACSNHFKKVIIIEPEQWLHNSEQGLEDHHRDEDQPKRSRVAQYTAYHHFHLFMTLVLKEMFPTFEETVRRIGGRFTLRYDNFWILGYQIAVPSGFPYYSGGIYPRSLSISRPAFETNLRRLVLQSCKEVQHFHGTVTGLLYDETTNRVTGVNVKLPDGEAAQIEGSLVVDATGPSLGGFRWLKALPKVSNSHSPPLQNLKISFDPKIIYSTCEFALPPKLEEEFRKYGFPANSDTSSFIYVSIPTGGADNRHVIIEKREKNFFHFVCGGYDWHGRIESANDIEEFLKELKPKKPFPDMLWEIVHALQRENVPASFRYSRCPPSVYIRYHEADYLPSNFIVVGDALSQTDPVTGQGCAKACAHSVVLNSQLDRITADPAGLLPPDFAKSFFLEVKDRTEHIWSDLKNTDYNFSSTAPLPGENLETTSRFLRSYANILLRLAVKDADVSGALYRQAAWLEPPTAMMAPWLLRRAAWAWVQQLFGYEIL